MYMYIKITPDDSVFSVNASQLQYHQIRSSISDIGAAAGNKPRRDVTWSGVQKPAVCTFEAAANDADVKAAAAAVVVVVDIGAASDLWTQNI